MYYWHWLKNIVRLPKTTGYPTESDPAVQAMETAEGHLRYRSDGPVMFRRAAAIRHVDGGSSNGCESELGLLASPDYDMTRYGFSWTPSPKHADILVVTGVITQAMVPVIRTVYDQMTVPKRVVALGSCAIDVWMFKDAPGVIGSLEGIVPVTLAIAGCPPTPGDILRGLIAVVDGVDPRSHKEEQA